MPYPVINNGLVLGVDTVTKISALVGAAGIAGVYLSPHFWRAVRKPGHFDTLDDECCEALGFDERDRAHIDNDVSPEIKERFRTLLVRGVRRRLPLLFSFRKTCRQGPDLVAPLLGDESDRSGGIPVVYVEPRAAWAARVREARAAQVAS